MTNFYADAPENKIYIEAHNFKSLSCKTYRLIYVTIRAGTLGKPEYSYFVISNSKQVNTIFFKV